MRKYKQIEYKAGATLEIIKCIPYGLRKGHPREKAEKKTKEEIRAANVRQAARRLARKINANFKPGDYHITLTYREPVSNEEAEKRIQNFLDRMRDRFKRRGFSFKYILVTEYKNKRIHHHIIINHINDGKRTTIDHVMDSRGLCRCMILGSTRYWLSISSRRQKRPSVQRRRPQPSAIPVPGT